MEVFTDMPILQYGSLVKEFGSDLVPKSIPFTLLNEEWAKRNHSQTLQRLAERGGLYPTEAIAIIAKRPFIYNQDLKKSIEVLNIHLKNHKASE